MAVGSAGDAGKWVSGNGVQGRPRKGEQCVGAPGRGPWRPSHPTLAFQARGGTHMSRKDDLRQQGGPRTHHEGLWLEGPHRGCWQWGPCQGAAL